MTNTDFMYQWQDYGVLLCGKHLRWLTDNYSDCLGLNKSGDLILDRKDDPRCKHAEFFRVLDGNLYSVSALMNDAMLLGPLVKRNEPQAA